MYIVTPQPNSLNVLVEWFSNNGKQKSAKFPVLRIVTKPFETSITMLNTTLENHFTQELKLIGCELIM